MHPIPALRGQLAPNVCISCWRSRASTNSGIHDGLPSGISKLALISYVRLSSSLFEQAGERADDLEGTLASVLDFVFDECLGCMSHAPTCLPKRLNAILAGIPTAVLYLPRLKAGWLSVCHRALSSDADSMHASRCL